MIVLVGLQTGLINVRDVNGEYVVDHADPIVAMTADLLVDLSRRGILTASTYGDLLLAGQVRYRLVGVDEGRNLVLQRVEDQS